MKVGYFASVFAVPKQEWNLNRYKNIEKFTPGFGLQILMLKTRSRLRVLKSAPLPNPKMFLTSCSTVSAVDINADPILHQVKLFLQPNLV